MLTNLDRYKNDLRSLLDKGDNLFHAIQAECFPEAFRQKVNKIAGKDKKQAAEKFLKGLPSFKGTYQLWYSEAKILMRQLLPDRLSDFIGHYLSR